MSHHIAPEKVENTVKRLYYKLVDEKWSNTAES